MELHEVYDVYLLKNGICESIVTCYSSAEVEEVKSKHLAKNDGTTLVYEVKVKDDFYEDKEVVYYFADHVSETLSGIACKFNFESEEEARNFVEQHKHGVNNDSEKEWAWRVFERRAIHRIYASGATTALIGDPKVTQI